MRRDLITVKPLQSSFLSCEKDTELLISTLFEYTQPYADILKRLLIINEPDCLDKEQYQDVIDQYSIGRLIREGYIRTKPEVQLPEHEDVKAYIIISFDNFTVNSTNEQFKDCTVNFDILCNLDAWNLDDYKLRPLQICGYIDGIFDLYNQSRNNISTGLTGIGKYVYMGCNMLVLNDQISGYTLSFRAVHFSEDKEDVE